KYACGADMAAAAAKIDTLVTMGTPFLGSQLSDHVCQYGVGTNICSGNPSGWNCGLSAIWCNACDDSICGGGWLAHPNTSCTAGSYSISTAQMNNDWSYNKKINPGYLVQMNGGSDPWNGPHPKALAKSANDCIPKEPDGSRSSDGIVSTYSASANKDRPS